MDPSRALTADFCHRRRALHTDWKCVWASYGRTRAALSEGRLSVFSSLGSLTRCFRHCRETRSGPWPSPFSAISLYTQDFCWPSPCFWRRPFSVLARRCRRQFVDVGLVTAEEFNDSTLRSIAESSGEIPARPNSFWYCWRYALSVTNLTSMAVHVSTWYALRPDSGITVTWAGWWLVLFCVPLMQFLILRWLWRSFLWAQFLWRMNRLKLQLVPTHPDQAAGLAFVGEVQQYFASYCLRSRSPLPASWPMASSTMVSRSRTLRRS